MFYNLILDHKLEFIIPIYVKPDGVRTPMIF